MPRNLNRLRHAERALGIGPAAGGIRIELIGAIITKGQELSPDQLDWLWRHPDRIVLEIEEEVIEAPAGA